MITEADSAVADTAPAPATPELGPPRGSTISRFLVVGPLGAGGMGVVVAAYDPTLDRKVAIKLLRPELAGERVEVRTARLLREAQAMARITHPNVIAVHEVGTYQDQVFVAMELVEGGSLAAWLAAARRPWREVLAAFLAAGRGLAAAHAAGMVHRDFKPDNVLVGRDGRVRVTDFGVVGVAGVGDEASVPSPALAEPLTRAGAIVGTPAFMAPEQREGRPVDARADQYAFCLALSRALVMPRWMRPIVQRGLAVEPAARHPSMAALLAALERGPLVTGARVAALGLAAAAVAGVVLLRARPESLACRGLDAPLAGVWDAPAAAAVEKAFLASGYPDAGDAFARVRAAFDAYRDGWVAMRTDACLAGAVRKEQSPALVDLRMRCLDRRLGGLGALARVLARADRGTVMRAVQAATALEPLDGCADGEALTAAFPPPSDPTRRAWVDAISGRADQADALQATGKPKAALAIAGVLVEEARATGHPPALLRALSRLAAAENDMDLPGARALLEETLAAAGQARDDAEIARALAGLLMMLGRERVVEAAALRPALAAAVARAGGVVALRVLEKRALAALAKAQGDAGGAERQLREALALQPSDRRAVVDLADLLMRRGACAEAGVLLERVLAQVEHDLGPNNVAAAAIYSALGGTAFCASDYERAAEHLGKLVTLVEKTYGPASPRLGGVLANRGRSLLALGRLDEGLADLRRALDVDLAALGPEHPDIGRIEDGIGRALMLKGDVAGGRAAFERALAIYEKRNPDDSLVGEILTNLGDAQLAQGLPEEALRTFQRSLALHEAEKPSETRMLAQDHSGIALALLALHRGPEALRHGELSWSMMSASLDDLEFRGDSAWRLARILGALHRQPGRATALALEGRALFVLGHHPGKVPAIDAWLAAR